MAGSCEYKLGLETKQMKISVHKSGKVHTRTETTRKCCYLALTRATQLVIIYFYRGHSLCSSPRNNEHCKQGLFFLVAVSFVT